MTAAIAAMTAPAPNIDALGGSLSQARHHYSQRLTALSNDYHHSHTLVKEYQQTAALLKELPAKLRHPVMVPLGPVAFFEGALTHTNEVLALLGDNYFIECSASHARSICQRRVHHIQDKLKLIRAEESQLRESMNAGSELFDNMRNEEGEEIVEIQEEYHSDDDDHDHDGHDSDAKLDTTDAADDPESASLNHSALTGHAGLTDAEFDSYWAALEAAEADDERGHLVHDDESKHATASVTDSESDEMALPSIESPVDIWKNMQARKARAAQSTQSSPPQSSQPAPTPSRAQLAAASPASSPPSKRVSFSELPQVAVINPLSTTSTPFTQYKTQRNSRHKSPVAPLPSASLPVDAPPSFNPAKRAAFSGAVMERAVDDNVNLNGTIREASPSAPAAAAQPKKLSKFRAARMGFDTDE